GGTSQILTRSLELGRLLFDVPDQIVDRARGEHAAVFRALQREIAHAVRDDVDDLPAALAALLQRVVERYLLAVRAGDRGAHLGTSGIEDVAAGALERRIVH